MSKSDVISIEEIEEIMREIRGSDVYTSEGKMITICSCVYIGHLLADYGEITEKHPFGKDKCAELFFGVTSTENERYVMMHDRRVQTEIIFTYKHYKRIFSWLEG